MNVLLEDALRRGQAIEDAIHRGEFRMATDFRPHTQYFHLLTQMRSSATESGVLALGGSTCCAFFTSWGDGFFPVYRDLDAGGGLVRLRIQLATEQSIANMVEVNR